MGSIVVIQREPVSNKALNETPCCSSVEEQQGLCLFGLAGFVACQNVMDDVSVAESDYVSDHLAFEWQLWFQLLEVGEADSKHLCSLVHINQPRSCRQ